MQDERVNVGAKLGNDELHALSHQPRDEMNIPAEAIELGHHNRAFATPRLREGCGELRAITSAPIFVLMLQHRSASPPWKSTSERSLTKCGRSPSRPRAPPVQSLVQAHGGVSPRNASC